MEASVSEWRCRECGAGRQVFTEGCAACRRREQQLRSARQRAGRQVPPIRLEAEDARRCRELVDLVLVRSSRYGAVTDGEPSDASRLAADELAATARELAELMDEILPDPVAPVRPYQRRGVQAWGQGLPPDVVTAWLDALRVQGSVVVLGWDRIVELPEATEWRLWEEEPGEGARTHQREWAEGSSSASVYPVAFAGMPCWVLYAHDELLEEVLVALFATQEAAEAAWSDPFPAS